MRLFNVGLWAAVFACCGAPLLVGCGSDDASERGTAESIGSVSVNLTGVSNSGVRYRLRLGLFEVNGPDDVLLSTENDPNASVISQELAVGNYVIELHDGWILEKETAGTFAPTGAQLLSPNPAGFVITEQGVTSVVFQFRAGDDVVDLGNGTLDVSISVQDDGVGCGMGEQLCGGACVDVNSDENNCGACGVACVAGSTCVSGACSGGGGSANFSADFTEAQDSPAQCMSWEGFRASIPLGASSITIRGSQDMIGVSCSGLEAQGICDALRTGTAFSTECNGLPWHVGFCGDGVEVTTTASGVCSCDIGSTVRPCIGSSNPNWGGVSGPTCFAPSQFIEVICQ